MVKIQLTISFFVFFSFETLAQQFGRLDNFWNVYARTNPAQTNSLDSLEVNLIGRAQWSGINGAPMTFYANYNQISPNILGSFGLSAEYDEIGFNKTYTVKGNYTYRLPTRIGLFSAGANLGWSRVGVSATWIPPQTLNDSSLPPNIPSQNDLVFDLGIAYKLNNLRIGFSVLQLSNLLIKPSPLYFDYAPHFALNAAYRLKFNEKWGTDFYWQTWGLTDRLTTDVSYIVNYKEKLELGLIVNNLFYHNSLLYGLSLGYNHKSGIGIYTSGTFTAPSNAFFENPTFEIGLKYRRN